MQRITTGSLRVFRAFGIDVFVHWSWFLAAVLMIRWGAQQYGNYGWVALQYLSLVAFVLLHEFGHALACRSVGGRAERIVLWPLGGVTLAAPPARPGALLWTVVAGPLVNLALVVPFAGLWLLTAGGPKDLHTALGMMAWMNAVLFAFNLVPVYPLDGGQALHALLWFGMGRWPALQATSAVGVAVGVMGLMASLFALTLRLPPEGPILFAVLCAFVAMQSAASFRLAQHAEHMGNLPRHAGCACPTCHAAPPRGAFWVCDECQTRFDTFDTRGKCPACGAWYLPTACPNCRDTHHIDRWYDYRPGVGLAAQPASAEEA